MDIKAVFLLTVFASLAFASEEIKRARLEVSKLNTRPLPGHCTIAVYPRLTIAVHAMIIISLYYCRLAEDDD